ncbi:hypothetical protein DXG01_003853 [Tephrocybe rancida]|nr:hypothetical protein DXG01_003853 [Tephrocybe rancida]
MPKSSKKAPVVATRPISDFFTRKSATAPPPIVKSVSTGQSASVKTTKPFASPPEKSVSASSTSIPSATKSTITISDASSPATPRSNRNFMDAVEIVSPNRSAMKNQYLRPPAFSAVKRAESASPRLGSLSPHPTPNNSQKTVFDSDSDVEIPAPSVYILRPPVRPAAAPSIAAVAPVPLRATENLTLASQIRTNSKKKQRLSSPEPCSELVPTSQSDELELASTISPQRDPKQVKRSVDEWRHNAVSAPFLSDDTFDNPPSFGLGGTPRDGVIPAISSLPPLPPSPLPLNPKTKAEGIIAEIKARAYAESLKTRPESPVLEFKDELSDSDDDGFPMSPMKGKGKAKASPFQESSKRYALRTREASPSPSAPKQPSGSTRSHVIPSRVPVVLIEQNSKTKRKTLNPLDDLLREKKRDDQRGKGSEAFRQAEAALADRDAIMFDGVDDDFTNEAAARKAVVERKRSALRSSSPGGHNVSDGEDDVDDEDRKRLLGEEQGKAVASLLSRDKASRQKEKEIEKLVGVPLWRASEDVMDVDQEALPKVALSTPHPMLSALQGAVDHGDTAQAALLIGSGVIFQLADNPAVIPYLCDLALSVDEALLSNSAVQALNHIWGTSLRPVLGLSFTCILLTFTRLGARSSVLNAMGWTLPKTNANSVIITPIKQNSMLFRLVALIASSARFRRLCKEEIPDILMAMILVANEPSTPHELQCDIALAIDAVCGSIASGGDIAASIESIVCTKTVKYLSTLEPVNKAYIVALFGSGCGRTRRIGRWIAHAIIANKSIVSPKRYSDLPSILPLLKELTRECSKATDAPGKFEQHDKTDFVDMAFYVQILGVAATNIVGYVVEERKVPPARPQDQATLELPDPPLILLRTAIENLHARISDIRATHLDRSRTKAILKELSLRIYYQRKVAQQSFRTLHTYFSKNKKPRGVSP